MKYILKNISIISFAFLFIFLLFKDPLISKESINQSFSLWINNLIPSLFPMIIINEILINYNFPIIICSFFYKLMNKLFKLSFNGTYIFIMSLFIGTPANALLIKNLLNNDMLEEDEVNKLLYVCYFSNPLFLYNMLLLIFSSSKVAIKIILIHYLSNFIILFIIRNRFVAKGNNKIHLKGISLEKLIPLATNKAINSLITILGVISFYILISNYFCKNSLIKGLLEITTGLNSLVLSTSKYKDIISIIIINFGGLSIATQIKSILEDTNLKFINYFKGRLFQIIISLIIYFIIFILDLA